MEFLGGPVIIDSRGQTHILRQVDAGQILRSRVVPRWTDLAVRHPVSCEWESRSSTDSHGIIDPSLCGGDSNALSRNGPTLTSRAAARPQISPSTVAQQHLCPSNDCLWDAVSSSSFKIVLENI